MYIFVHTPLNKNSKFLAHRAEHCVLSKEGKYNNEAIFFSSLKNKETGTNNSYTRFWLPNSYSASNFIKKLCLPINTTVAENELEILHQEYQHPSYMQRLSEKIWKKITNKTIYIAKPTKHTFKELSSYHKKRYIPYSCIITSNSHQILSTSEKKLKKISIQKNSAIYSDYLSFEKFAYKLIRTKYDNRVDIIYLHFLHNLIDNYYYFQSLSEKSYRYPDTSLSNITDHGCIVLEKKSAKITITEKFLEGFKKHYLSYSLKHDHANTSVVLSGLFLSQDVDKQDLTSYILSLSLEKIQGDLAI